MQIKLLFKGRGYPAAGETMQVSILRGIPHAGSHRPIYTRIVLSLQLQPPRSSFRGTQFTLSEIKPILSHQLGQLPTTGKTVTLGVTGGVLGVWDLEQAYHKSYCPWPRVKKPGIQVSLVQLYINSVFILTKEEHPPLLILFQYY